MCRRCELRAGAHGVVFGEGSPAARVVFCGEGPGAEEDRLLRPFVGAAGRLLDQMLAAMGFERFRDVYILNVVKCRPPQNRIPTEEEREQCRPNLLAQLRIINPVIIVLLGATAVQTLIDPAARITRVRGQWFERDGRWLMPTYHPAALLRNPAWKREAWEDLKRVLDKYRELVDPGHDTPYYPLARRSEGAMAGVRQVPPKP
ncbi:MAG: uracil-DNA glycosylase [Firmicutes bacterium]|nr:uracil-DNA glycosylase [Alicyclobacillaceae bacterium]MCL6497885.1 uracil-DNA glycosylase [Bacillota bacterium]